ncbi:fimbria/pilus outer membrane usher protein [Pantoea sp. X85]|jgi:outer membrane usher protein|uniref:fimbria/pilus outer membrane usher protein n=1 Tax=Pantoea sp. X85 TaxID=3037258 RepID=UPI0024138E31|nr:fimbria/pilus outer membrane usher protein [Pantoea sp. X85]WFL66914.1 fimbria/pilus outer membrane usher protein [Pantoea sp. X85]
MKFTPHPCALAVASVLCISPMSSSAETFSELPPPPALENNASGQQYMLELVVNQGERGDIVPVERKNGDFWLRRGDLQRAGIPAEKLQGQQIDVNQLSGAKVEYDERRQRLLLTVPPAWLPGQTIGQLQHAPRFPGRASNGALLNYDFYATRTDNAGSRLSSWNELRLFGPAGQFSTNGVYVQQLEGGVAGQQEGYIRYDTWFSNENENAAISWRAGDLVTDALSWSNSVRLGGVQIGRDFSVRPDLVTYPLPAFSGQAAVPSSVDLFINGYRSTQADVQPGPWSLTNVPFVNGAGDAVITTTDAVGRQVTTTLPFYVSSSLLKTGLSDYSFSAGAIRENYGINNFDYGAAAASGSYRYGLNDWLTLESHAEGSDSVAMGGAGGLVKLGSLGVVNGALAQSQMDGNPGTQYSWGYQYNNSWFSLGTQHIIRSVDFGNLALVGSRGDSANTSYSLARRSAQYTASVSLSDYGSLGLAYFDISGGNGDRTRLLNLSWSKNLWGNSSLYISASRDQDQGNWSGAISLIIPFGEQSSASVSTERDQEGNNSQRLYVSRAMPTDGGFSWDAAWANQGSDSGDYRQASLRYRNNKIDTSAGFYGDNDNTTQWADFTGSVVLMDNRVFAANDINDAFVVVKTDYPDVTVRYENQTMGRTDKQGYLLVPSISSYYGAKYDIDTLDLPADRTAPKVEQRFAVKRKSGYLLNFPVERLRAASVVLHDSNHQPLPISSQVLRPNQATEYVGWDGIVWMEDLDANNPIHVVTPDGRSCDTQLAIADGQPKALETYGPLTCPLPPPPQGSAVSSADHSPSGISP